MFFCIYSIRPNMYTSLTRPIARLPPTAIPPGLSHCLRLTRLGLAVGDIDGDPFSDIVTSAGDRLTWGRCPSRTRIDN